MLTEALLSVCALICFYLSYRYAVGRPKGFPPGPPRIPFFGSYLFMMLSNFRYMHKAVLNFSKWYKSDIVGFHMGPFPVVAVHDSDSVRQILNNSVFDGRPQIFLAAMRDPNHNINEGVVWKDQRRFILRYLRDFGFGRRFQELELIIQEEITDMLDLIRHGPRFEHEKEIVQDGGYRVLLPHLFNPFSVNSLLYVMLNERQSRAQAADLVKLVKMGMQFQRNSDDYGKMLSIMPWIRHVFPNMSSYNTIMEANHFIYGFFAKFVDHYIATYDEGSERNFLDMYVKEMKAAEANGDKDSAFKRDQLILSLIDFSLPAFTSVGSQISLLVQYLMLYPEVLKRIQAEIDDVVGSGRLPTLEDRQYLSYTEATIREGLRIETLVPSDVPHKALQDTELCGFHIPKDTIVVPSLHAYHNDKRIWGDPQNFRPERFLDENGKLSLKTDVSLPFGAGKRLCAGETFARNMLFLLTAALCQNFNIVLGPNDKLPDLTKTLSGLIISPPDFWVQLEEREV